MNLTPKRLAVLEELYFEGPTTNLPWRQLNDLLKAGLVEQNLLTSEMAVARGLDPVRADRERNDDAWYLESDAYWRISDYGRKLMEDHMGGGNRPDLAAMPCMGTA